MKKLNLFFRDEFFKIKRKRKTKIFFNKFIEQDFLNKKKKDFTFFVCVTMVKYLLVFFSGFLSFKNFNVTKLNYLLKKKNFFFLLFYAVFFP